MPSAGAVGFKSHPHQASFSQVISYRRKIGHHVKQPLKDGDQEAGRDCSGKPPLPAWDRKLNGAWWDRKLLSLVCLFCDARD